MAGTCGAREEGTYLDLAGCPVIGLLEALLDAAVAALLLYDADEAAAPEALADD